MYSVHIFSLQIINFTNIDVIFLFFGSIESSAIYVCLATGWVGGWVAGLIRVKDHCSIILLDVMYIIIFVAPYIYMDAP